MPRGLRGSTARVRERLAALHIPSPTVLPTRVGKNGRVATEPSTKRVAKSRARMSGRERREQLIGIGRSLFADKGFEGTTVEEIAQRAGVSKPVV